MPEPRRTFTAEFKKQMVQLYESGKSRANIIKEYDLSASPLDRYSKACLQSRSKHLGEVRSHSNDS